MSERVQWSDLPKELWSAIGKRLDTRIDVLRFRSACRSWRSSIPTFHAHCPRFPLKFPSPYPASTAPPSLPAFGFPYLHEGSYESAYLCRSTFYSLQELNPSSTSSFDDDDKGWLVEVEESNSGKLRLLDPSKLRLSDSLLNNQIRYPLNLLNFRIVELTKAYTLTYHFATGPRSESERIYVQTEISIPGVNKVVMFPNSAWTNAEGCSVFVIFHDGKLGFAKCGDEKLTIVDDQSFDYDDIIVYKGQLYVVDMMGVVSCIEYSSLKLVQFSPPLCGLGSQKHLVESCGALYVVDRYLYRGTGLENYNRPRGCLKAVDFKVYKLDEEWGQWVLVKSLGDRVFILGTDFSFSMSARKFVGYKSNCIYFIDQHQNRVFNLEDHSIFP